LRSSLDNYKQSADGIYRSASVIKHRDDEYDQVGFKTLYTMQKDHFWYRGRHRFLLKALDRLMPKSHSSLQAIDLGGGVGGWVRYLADRRGENFQKIALADSSTVALSMAGEILPPGVDRYQIDLMNLDSEKEWNIAFMLDVIEHIPDDIRAVRQAAKALKPGGLLFVATPAFQQLWSYNDDVANHLRRYTRSDFKTIAEQTGLKLLDSRYFMFLLSPLYLLSRFRPGFDKLSQEEKRKVVESEHKVPPAPLNAALTAVFAAETPLGHWLSFPWGTSVLGIFSKP
jgi:2-polyprenyl-3-methyl-5-hydroxy-6-metoxy-1,4-benzoquinol methylase